jgi:hypothetical protein
MSDISKYLQSVEDRIDSVNTCEMLQALSDEVMQQLQDLLDGLAEQQAALTLQITPPTDLATTIAWITAQINATVKPITETLAEVILITTHVTSIMTKLTTKIATLGCSFTPTPPTP